MPGPISHYAAPTTTRPTNEDQGPRSSNVTLDDDRYVSTAAQPSAGEEQGHRAVDVTLDDDRYVSAASSHNQEYDLPTRVGGPSSTYSLFLSPSTGQLPTSDFGSDA